MLSISTTDAWRDARPGAAVGLLELSGADNAHSSAGLETRKRETEAHLRERYRGFTRQDFLALPVMTAYAQYYKRFNKTYHVQLQVESIVLKGKNLSDVSPLVDANFAAEVETFILTAGHEVAKLGGPISIDVSAQGDQMTQMIGMPGYTPSQRPCVESSMEEYAHVRHRCARIGHRAGDRADRVRGGPPARDRRCPG
jgi:DNA/RNA-binding domain of Phe-tRNA-synthetase-like protein